VDDGDMRLDELAQRAGVATTTVRLYQARGLLAGPRLAGRTGFYDDTHLARLRLIARLQQDGFSLAGIGHLLSAWRQGRDLADLVGLEAGLDALLASADPVVLDPADFLGRFPAGSVTPELIDRAARLGLIETTADGQLRVPDRRFLDTGSTLAALGIPVETIIDEWEHLVVLADQVADRFIALFERYVLPPGWREGLDDGHRRELAATLTRLRDAASGVAVAALERSLAERGVRRLGALADPSALQ
jgi:DNA-binding transcriptional MerR regulator